MDIPWVDILATVFFLILVLLPIGVYIIFKGK